MGILLDDASAPGRFNGKVRDLLKVPSIVGQKRKMVDQRSGRNEEIEITHGIASISQLASKLTEPPAGFLVETKNGHSFQKRRELTSAACGVFGKVNALPQLRNRDDADGKALRLEFLKAAGSIRNTVEVVDDPVGVDEGCKHVTSVAPGESPGGGSLRYAS